MSDRLSSLPSLPPEIQGKIHGLISIEIGEVSNSTPLLLRVLFWGESGPGIILKTPGAPNSELASKATYTIRVTQQAFTSYLKDMGSLELDVTDMQWRFIGKVRINVKMYFRKDARDHLSLEIDGNFPIINNGENKGEVEIKVITDYQNWFQQRKRQDSDPRIANSLLADRPSNQKYDHKALQQHPDPEHPEQRVLFEKQEEIAPDPNAREIAAKIKPTDVFVPQTALKKIPKQDPSVKNEIDKLKARGELLRKKLQDTTEERPQAAVPLENKPIPSSKEIENYQLPYDPTEEIKPKPPVLPRQEEEPEAMPDFQSIEKLKLQVSTLTLMVDRREIQDKTIYIEGSVPIPIRSEKQGFYMQTDSFKISHKGAYENIYHFNHESFHKFEITEGVFGELASSSIKFRLMASQAKAKPVELGKIEISWGKILMAPKFKYAETLEFAGKSNKTGKLNIEFEIEKKEQPKITIPEEPPSPVEVKETKSFQMYLFVDSATQLKSRPNLYLSYKTFPDYERISTPVIWDYEDSEPISHYMMFPVNNSENTLSKLSKSHFVIEVWDKVSPSANDLMGIVKLSLAVFENALDSELLVDSVYPLIAVDEYRAITSIGNFQDVGFLRVCLAIGTAIQVHRLQVSHKSVPRQPKLKNLSPPREKPMDSIEDLAAFLNDKAGAPEQVEELKIEDNLDVLDKEKHVHVEPSPLKYEDEVPEKLIASGKPEEIIEKRSPELVIKELNDEEIIKFFLDANETVDIENELKNYDKHDHGYLHSESFFNLFKLSVPEEVLQRLIGIIISRSEKSSTRKLFILEILSVLQVIPKDSPNIKHTFYIKVAELISSSMPQSMYLKYLFPLESSYIESEKIEDAINLEAKHTFTQSRTKSLTESFGLSSVGVQFFLCRNVGHEEKIIGKGLLPVEELAEMTDKEKQNRVICLYGENQSKGNELIGKIKMSIRYTQEFTYEEPGEANELVYEKKTEVQRLIPKHNKLSVYVISMYDLNRALAYYTEMGIDLRNYSIFLRFDCFYEDSSLGRKFPKIISDQSTYGDSIRFNFKGGFDLVLEENILNYMRNKAGLLEVLGAKQGEELTLASSRISLVPLLMNSLVSGEFALLNDYGQFMGCANLKLSLQTEEDEESEEELPIIKEEKTFKEISTSPMQSTVFDKPEIEGIHVQVTVEAVMQINEKDIYVQFDWFSSQLYSTPSTYNNFWNSNFSLKLPTEAIKNKENIEFEIWHKTPEGNEKIGTCPVETHSLINVAYIDGWYHVYSKGRTIGQLKVKIFPAEDVYEKLYGKKRQVFSATNEQDLKFRTDGREELRTFNLTKDLSVKEEETELGRKTGLLEEIEEKYKEYSIKLDMEDDDEVLRKHRENMLNLDNICQKMTIDRFKREEFPKTEMNLNQGQFAEQEKLFRTFNENQYEKEKSLQDFYQNKFNKDRTDQIFEENIEGKVLEKQAEFSRSIDHPTEDMFTKINRNPEISPYQYNIEYEKLNAEYPSAEHYLHKDAPYRSPSNFNQSIQKDLFYTEQRPGQREIGHYMSTYEVPQREPFRSPNRNIYNDPLRESYSDKRVDPSLYNYRQTEGSPKIPFTSPLRQSVQRTHREVTQESYDWLNFEVDNVLKTIQEASNYATGTLDEEDNRMSYQNIQESKMDYQNIEENKELINPELLSNKKELEYPAEQPIQDLTYPIEVAQENPRFLRDSMQSAEHITEDQEIELKYEDEQRELREESKARQKDQFIKRIESIKKQDFSSSPKRTEFYGSPVSDKPSKVISREDFDVRDIETGSLKSEEVPKKEEIVPAKITSRPPIPKHLLSNPEMSRIAAIFQSKTK